LKRPVHCLTVLGTYVKYLSAVCAYDISKQECVCVL
jgi:hypothetical protein